MLAGAAGIEPANHGIKTRKFQSRPILSCHDTPCFPPFSDGNAAPLSRPIPPIHAPSGANSGAKNRRRALVLRWQKLVIRAFPAAGNHNPPENSS